MECPICQTVKQSYVTFRCTHSVCRTCLFQMMSLTEVLRCPLCREDISEQMPREMLDEVITSHQHRGIGGVIPGIGTTQNDDDESADEFDSDVTHIKIRYGAHEVAYIRNDGKSRTLSFEDEGVTFRIEYRNRRCFLYRSDSPDTPIPLHPLTAVCAIPPPQPTIPTLN